MDLAKIKTIFSVIKDIPEAIPVLIKILRALRVDATGPDEKGSWHIVVEGKDGSDKV
jgi:hypothetical protein